MALQQLSAGPVQDSGGDMTSGSPLSRPSDPVAVAAARLGAPARRFHAASTADMQSRPSDSSGGFFSATDDPDISHFGRIWEVVGRNSERARNTIAERGGKGGTTREFQIGASVGLRVPKIDKGCLDPKYIPCAVVDKRSVGKGPRARFQYKLRAESGLIKQWYPASEIMQMMTPPGRTFSGHDSVEGVANITVTGAARMQQLCPSSFAGHCGCKKDCSTRSCVCKKNNVECTSMCHRGMACKNKDVATGQHSLWIG